MRQQTVGLLARAAAASTAGAPASAATASRPSLLQQGSGIALFHAGTSWTASPQLPPSLLGGAGSQDNKEQASVGPDSINSSHPLLRLPVSQRSAGPFARPWGAVAGVTFDAPKYGRPRPYGNTIDTWAKMRGSYDSTTYKRSDLGPAMYMLIGVAAFGMWFQDVYAYPPRTVAMLVTMALLLYVRREGFIPSRAALGLPPKTKEDTHPPTPAQYSSTSASDHFQL